MQWWNLLNARVLMTSHGPFHKLSENKNFILVFAFIFILQLLIVEVFNGEVFRTTNLSLVRWLVLIAVTSLVLLIGLALRHHQLKKQQ